MNRLSDLAASRPAAAKDIALNLETLLRSSSLSAAQRGTLVASAIASRNQTFLDTVLASAPREVHPSVIDNAVHAAAVALELPDAGKAGEPVAAVAT